MDEPCASRAAVFAGRFGSKAGLSHMADCLQKEGVVPACAFDFAAYRGLMRNRLQDVECKLSHEGKVLGRVVFPRSIAVLGEMDVENPMEAILDAPVAPSDLQKPLRRHIFRKDI